MDQHARTAHSVRSLARHIRHPPRQYALRLQLRVACEMALLSAQKAPAAIAAVPATQSPARQLTPCTIMRQAQRML
jgi:hypothetical protein